MPRTSSLFAFAVALVTASLLAACAQDEGERCEVNTDCKAGLVCDRKNAPSGFCRTTMSPTVTDAGGSDTATPVVDAASVVDTAADAAPADAAPADGVPADVSPDSTPDARTDAVAGN